MRTRTGDAAPLLEREEDGQCKRHRPTSNSSARTVTLAIAAVLLVLWCLGAPPIILVASFLLRSDVGASVVISNGQITMHVLPVGAIIQRLYVPDRLATLAHYSTAHSA